jgi:hypothetical protein
MSAVDKVVAAARLVVNSQSAHLEASTPRAFVGATLPSFVGVTIPLDVVAELEAALTAYDKKRAELKDAVKFAG